MTYGETEAVLQICSQEKMFWKYAPNLQENTHAGDFNKVVKLLYWNLISKWVFSCKSTAYFQNTSGELFLKKKKFLKYLLL